MIIKYSFIFLLFLVSCSTLKPNCETKEHGTILGSEFSILECTNTIKCDQNNTECQRTEFAGKNRLGKYIYIRRD